MLFLHTFLYAALPLFIGRAKLRCQAASAPYGSRKERGPDGRHFLISVAHELTIVGAIVLLAGLLTMAWPIAAVGWATTSAPA